MLNDKDSFPELKANAASLAETRVGRQALAAARKFGDSYYPIPELSWSLWRDCQRTGNRSRGQAPYFARRANLAAAVAHQLLDPSPEMLDVVCDYLWSICEETTWVLPAHEHGGGLDLFDCETGFALAEARHALGDQLPEEVDQRVEYEVTARIIDPALTRLGSRRVDGPTTNLMDMHLRRRVQAPYWDDGHNNWAGVCASSIGGCLLHLQRDRDRLVRGLNKVLVVLRRFLDNAFAADGASDEGLGYWQYGLINFIPFAEMLRVRTSGRVDLLGLPRLRTIAGYPARVMLSNGRVYSHADCMPRISLSPGVTTRLAERTGVEKLRGLIGRRIQITAKLPVLLRDLCWWDGAAGKRPPITDTLQETSGIWRLKAGAIVLAGKAGHNGESHNHNDVGSFCLHAGGQDLLADPGAPEYTKSTFSPRRYEVYDQTATRGHCLPLIDGVEQEKGSEFTGRVETFAPEARPKCVEMEIAGAYPIKSLKSLRRRIELTGEGFELADRFEFAGKGRSIQEAFVTWLPVTIRGRSAVIRGEKFELTLTPADKAHRFSRAVIDIPPRNGNPEAAANGWKLKRLSIDLPVGTAAFAVSGRLSRR
jgi:hypothetical protein